MPLREVVDATLYDEYVGTAGAIVETRPDLVGPLTVDAAVAKPKAWISSSRPELPLTRLVSAGARVVAR
jgi:hypothetical protein